MFSPSNEWVIEASEGPAGPFHHAPLPSPPLRPTVWIHRVERSAIVLGSAQPDSVIRRDEAEAAGYEVCRRRSGGGLVVVDPDTSRWIDFLIPTDSSLWVDDVGRAFDWVGATWQRALGRIGLEGVEVHRGPLLHREWGRAVCFAGLGTGEVSVAGRKVVGLSQRRTRDGARFQGLVVTDWDPAPIRRFVAPGVLPLSLDDQLEDLAVGVPVNLDQVVEAVIAELPPAS